MEKELVKYLEGFITEKRKALFEKVIAQRTKYLTVVLEDIYQSQNASAVLRSCDCFGVQDVHVIENRNEFTLHRDIAMGSSKWLTLNHYNNYPNNTLEAINQLKQQGYRIVATTPHTNDTNLEDFDLTKGKSAFIFGTELTGVSQDVIDNADEFVKIPMHGFTESFNISVCVALVIHHLTLQLRNSEINWQLSEEDIADIKLNWLRQTLKRFPLLEERFRNS
ncbi:TrmH family RNA methyltransferase [Prolixibacteraceae bacterium JC049]|nr:TrmH family RNA methyltransferase [Prolixibacteraceae bacterium JC049]